MSVRWRCDEQVTCLHHVGVFRVLVHREEQQHPSAIISTEQRRKTEKAPTTSFTSVLPGGKNECEICRQHKYRYTPGSQLGQEATCLRGVNGGNVWFSIRRGWELTPAPQLVGQQVIGKITLRFYILKMKYECWKESRCALVNIS